MVSNSVSCVSLRAISIPSLGISPWAAEIASRRFSGMDESIAITSAMTRLFIWDSASHLPLSAKRRSKKRGK